MAPKTTDQLRAIFGLGKKKGLDKEQIEAIAGDITAGRTFRLSELYFHEANIIIVRLGGEAFPAPIEGAAPRTVRHHRQKAGVKQIAQTRHVKLLNGMAADRWGKEFEAPLRKLADRMRIAYPPRTTAETNKLIEAIKAMNNRSASSARSAPSASKKRQSKEAA